MKWSISVLGAWCLFASSTTVARGDVVLELGDNLLAGDSINFYEFDLSGTMTGFEIVFDFDPLDAGGAWASDMVFVLIGPGLEGVSWGGFNTDFGFPSQGTWAFDGSGSAAAGTYTDSVVHGAQSDGVWTLGIGNGWTTSGEVSYNNVSVTLLGSLTAPCRSDLDGNGLVNAGDLGKILGEWGDACCGSDIDGDGDVNAADIAALLADWGTTCEPVIESISPDSVLAEGGAEVAITGRHLAAATSVSIGGSDAAIVSTSVDGVVVTAPPGTPGPAEVVVTTPFGEQTLTGAFEYAAPLAWATTLDYVPDPKVITDPEWRERIIATGLPWRVRDNASQIEMLLVPPGSFDMGCSPSDQQFCYDAEYPIHAVNLTQPFYLGRYEVTQAQWTAVMGSNPSYFNSPSVEVPATQVPNRPVESVPWVEVQAFEAATGLRLPTEAEWEYACRAGTQTAFNLPPSGTDDDDLLGQLAWVGSNSASQTHPVGQKQANNLGLHDMLGNVFEWCEDWYGATYYSASPAVDPLGPASGELRVIRGGSIAGDWVSTVRSSFRGGVAPETFRVQIPCGFRAARFPYVPEICDNGLDDDGDGLVDCDDPDCAGLPVCGGGWSTVLEFDPDPKVITDPEWRERIISTGLPWRVRDNISQIEMLLVPPGTFDMGCSPSDQYGCGSDGRENPVHEVTLTQAFYLGRYEVTQAQWTAVMGSNPSSFQSPSSQVPAEQVPNRPVEKVSWNNVQAFEAETGLRLPTEAEWEYACRAGTQTAFNLPPDGTNDDDLLGQLAWINNNSDNQTHPVGQKQANNLGLHDMHGNVWEWVEDRYGSGYYAQSPSVDPPGPTSGAARVLRGGSWSNAMSYHCRASFRDPFAPGFGFGFGFRAARTP